MDKATHDGKAPPGLISLGLKGGPGKSTLAGALALKIQSLLKEGKVTLFDADVFDPNLPELLGYDGGGLEIKENTYIPVEHHGLQIISRALYHVGPLGFTQSSDVVSLFIREVAKHTAWNGSPLVVIDLPAGSGVELRAVVESFDLVGGVVITLPSTPKDCEAILDLMYHTGIPRLGVVENMLSMKCSCGKTNYPFGRGAIKKVAKAQNVPYLGSVPLSPRISGGLKKGQLTSDWDILDDLVERLFKEPEDEEAEPEKREPRRKRPSYSILVAEEPPEEPEGKE